MIIFPKVTNLFPHCQVLGHFIAILSRLGARQGHEKAEAAHGVPASALICGSLGCRGFIATTTYLMQSLLLPRNRAAQVLLLLLECSLHLGSDACKLRINHDATAIFTHDYLLVHLYLHLALRRNAVEATTAGVTLDIHDTQSVACVLADALEC